MVIQCVSQRRKSVNCSQTTNESVIQSVGQSVSPSISQSASQSVSQLQNVSLKQFKAEAGLGRRFAMNLLLRDADQ